MRTWPRRWTCCVSTALIRPGDWVDDEISKLKQELVRLEKIVQRQGIPAAAAPTQPPSGLAWTPVTPQPTLGAKPLPRQHTAGPVSQMVNPDLKALERRVLHFEQQLDAQAVKIGSITFTVRREADGWLKTHCPAPGAYTYFLDFHSLLTLTYGPGGSMAEI
jgi:hypothetical protein